MTILSTVRGRDRLARLADGSTVGYAVYGDPGGTPLFVFHGFPGSRLSGELLDEAARLNRMRAIAPDRPGIGLSSPKPDRRLLDYPGDVSLLADALELKRFAVAGLSGGGPYAAACAFAIPERLRAAAIVCGLGPPETPGATKGMALGERVAFAVGRRFPGFGGRFLERVAAGARRSEAAFLKAVEANLPERDRRALTRPEVRRNFVEDFIEAFRQGGREVGRDLALLVCPWGFRLGDIGIRVHVYHGELDRTVPVQAGRYQAEAIPDCVATFYPEDGHFSIVVERAGDILAEVAAAAKERS